MRKMIQSKFREALNLHQAGRLQKAQKIYQEILEAHPDDPESLHLLGVLCHQRRNYQGAVELIQQSILLASDSAISHKNLGVSLTKLGKFNAAIESFNKAILINKKYAEAYYNLGNALKEVHRLEEALQSYSQAIKLKADYSLAYFNRGCTHRDLFNLSDAKKDFHQAIQYKPDLAEVPWCLSTLETYYNFYDASKKSVLKKFEKSLHYLNKWLDEKGLEKGFKGVGASQPFFLAYQEIDNSAVLKFYGSICNSVMGDWQRKQNLFPKRNKHSPLKIGFVSGHIYNHSVWNAITKGLLLNLDANNFKTCIFSLGTSHDQQTDLARSLSSVFVEGDKSLQEWVIEILNQKPDVLIYPEIGLHPMTLKLASLRLAELQLVSWGHPETTGLTTIDYYISAEDFESEASDQFYTEKLIRLPNLGGCYEEQEKTPKLFDFKKYNLHQKTPIILCPGSHFKYAREFDWVWAEIAKRLGDVQIVFFENPKHKKGAELLRGFLKKQFVQSGLAFDDYIKFIPWLDHNSFYSLMRESTIFLDTIGFSGFNTGMQAVEADLPIVTRKGKFMRGRFASGILDRMGMQDMVANTEEEYVALAVRLCQDKAFNKSYRMRIKTHRHLLYRDKEPIKAFEIFLLQYFNQPNPLET